MGQTYKGGYCSLASPKSREEINSGKKRVKKKTPAVWDHVLFGLGGSGTGRNVESPSEQERNISSSGGCF